MKNNKRKPVKILTMACLVMLCVVLGAIPAVKAQAASGKAAALAAYKKMLSQESVPWGDDGLTVSAKNCKFALAYVDKDTVPELILRTSETPHAIGYGAMFTYKNGKAACVSLLNMDSSSENETGFSYYKKKGIFTDFYFQGGWGTTHFCKLSGTKTADQLIRSVNYLSSSQTPSYNKVTKSGARKAISKKKYNNRLKELVGSKKPAVPKFYDNTASKRKKYLK